MCPLKCLKIEFRFSCFRKPETDLGETLVDRIEEDKDRLVDFIPVDEIFI